MRTTLLLLPGLDGTGSLFAPFLEALPARFEAVVARYAFDETNDEALRERVERPRGEFIIVAESFSGPLGVLIAADCERVRALVLAASFARNPTPLTHLAPLLGMLPSPPARVAEAMMTNGARLPALAQILREVPRHTLVRRLEAVRTYAPPFSGSRCPAWCCAPNAIAWCLAGPSTSSRARESRSPSFPTRRTSSCKQTPRPVSRRSSASGPRADSTCTRVWRFGVPVRLTLTLRLTQAQGLALDALAGLGLASALTTQLHATPTLRWVGLLAGAALGLRWTRRRAAAAAEAATPETRHALSAWLEGGGGSLRERLEAWLEARVRVPWLKRSTAAAALALAVSLLPTRPIAGSTPPPAEEAAASPASSLTLTARLEPPAYSRRPPVEGAGPRFEALKGSRVTLRWRSTAATIMISEPGQPDEPLTTNQGLATQTFLLTRSRVLRASISGGGAPLLLELEATADAPPTIELIAPDADRVVTTPPDPFELRALARDDLGLASTTLHYSLSQGTGEAVHFKVGRLPARTHPAADDALVVEGRVAPASLGMAAGDTLVVWAEATDTNAVDGPARARSSVRVVRWEVPVAPMAGGTGAMPPPPRSLLTQRELLARTERLVRRGLRGAALQAATVDLAQDQRSLRLSFSQVLNAEEGQALTLDVDEKEAAETTDSQARAWLAKAVSAMWDSESELDLTRPERSLAPQRAAVAALDKAFALIRFSLRPAAQPDKPVDELRRLTGRPAGLTPPARALAEPPRRDEAMTTLALSLLGAAARGLDQAEATRLADGLWAMPAPEGVPTAQLAAALYAASTAEARAHAARLAGEALARLVSPAHLVVFARDEGGSQVVARASTK